MIKYLNIDRQHQIKLPLEDLIGESIAVLGIRGSGKTNTAAVLIEELLSAGLPLTIVDIEGEYWGLKEKFEILVIGHSPNTDIDVTVQHASRFAEFSIQNSVPMILDLSEYSHSEASDFLLRYFRSLWKNCFTVRRPYEIILEEAHEFVPQSSRSPLKDVLTRIALRGRKRGLGLILVSQRSAKVEKDILTQASLLLLHRVVHPIDLKVYQDIIPLPSRQVEELVTKLQRGEAIFYFGQEVKHIRVRVRETFHAGATPELSAAKAPNLRKIDKRMLEELRLIASQPAKTKEEDEVQRLERILAEKEQEIEHQKEIIEDLRTQTEILSKLSISIKELPVIITPPSSNTDAISDKQVRDNQSSAAQFQTELECGSLDVEAQRQKKRFNVMLQDIARLPHFQRRMLRFLLEREDISMNARNLAKWLDLSETTIKNRPPLDLIKMKLLIRSGSKGNYTYRSSVRQTLSEDFAALDLNVLIDKVLMVCR